MNNLKVLKALTELKLRQDNNNIKVTGTSMEPVIYDGDTAYIEKIEKYRIGDIVVAIDTKGWLLIHRIVRIKEGIINIKGDNAVAIETVRPDDCFGRVVFVKSKDGAEFILKRSFKDKVIAYLSLMMNKRWRASKDYAGTINGWQHRIMCFLSKRR